MYFHQFHHVWADVKYIMGKSDGYTVVGLFD